MNQVRSQFGPTCGMESLNNSARFLTRHCAQMNVTEALSSKLCLKPTTRFRNTSHHSGRHASAWYMYIDNTNIVRTCNEHILCDML